VCGGVCGCWVVVGVCLVLRGCVEGWLGEQLNGTCKSRMVTLTLTHAGRVSYIS